MSFLSIVKEFAEGHGLKRSSVWTADETTSIPKTDLRTQKAAAVGTDLFDLHPSIKVPKLSLLCACSAEGHSLPPLILVPRSKGKSSDTDIPLVGPEGCLEESICHSTHSAAMTKAEFPFWLLNIFAPFARQTLEEHDWILLLIDNCSC